MRKKRNEPRGDYGWSHAYADVLTLRRKYDKLKLLIAEAPKFFAVHDFDGEKLSWLKRAGLIADDSVQEK